MLMNKSSSYEYIEKIMKKYLKFNENTEKGVMIPLEFLMFI